MAGILDGEGAFIIRHQNGHRSYYPVIQVCNTDIGMVGYLLAITGIGKIAPYPTKGNRKDAFKWTVFRKDVLYALLDSVYPYLITKREKANLLYRLRSVKDAPLVRKGVSRGRLMLSAETVRKCTVLFAKMRELNFRGCVAKEVNSEEVQNGQLRAEPADCVRQLEGVEVRAEETIMPISASLERDDMTRAA